LPLAEIFGDSLQLSRAVSFIFLIASTALIIFVTRKKDKASILLSVAGSLVFYDAILRDGYSVLSRPDALGLFLFLAGILIPYYYNYSRKSLIVSILFAIYGFYTKPYFIAIIGYVGAYLFLFVSKKKAVIYGVSFLSIFAPLAYVCHKLLPFYFNNVYTINANNTPNDVEYMYGQFFRFTKDYFLLIIVLIVLTSLFIIRNKDNIRSYLNEYRNLINLKTLSAPLITKSVDLYLFCLTCSTAIIFLKLGRHTGAYMTYLYQLMVPFLVLLIIKYSSKLLVNNYLKIFVAILLLLNSLIIGNFYINNLNLNSKAESWSELNELVSKHENMFAIPAVTSILIEQNKTVYDTGQIEFFYAGNQTNQHFVSIYNKYLDKINSQLKDRKFEVVLLPEQYNFAAMNKDILYDSYYLDHTTQVAMPYVGQVWNVEVWYPN
jgi:hypothetical protein